ncbi:hypothetical protein NECAME_03310 [Necator americanus]|uniref:Reverse transcriptase/retrotransposon-derived protein RNase H-like domain-containing protein n=1 Tax=Necator americanus TaxID=51031 RepID=W2T6V1_NECAM|nr:hypothetical protein NECAME_03310 [Necator americanus]ETN76881.1 hypothetical protein NECAME_03310 [Necator americanus]
MSNSSLNRGSLVPSYDQLPSFVAEMRQLRALLNALLKKNVPFKWNEECEAAFICAKEVLASDLLWMHFDPSLDIIVAADAADYGIRTVVVRRMLYGTEKAICHASQSLTTVTYMELRTNHKSLLHIFGPKKMPVNPEYRLQR